MKFKTTMKKIKEENNTIIQLGYCDAQTLLSHSQPIAYTCGVYGWNSDIYKTNGVAICTGYRAFGNVKPSRKLIDYYEEKAKTVKNSGLHYEEKKNKISKLLDDFIKEALQC